MEGNLSLWREKCVLMLPSASTWTLAMRRDVDAVTLSFGAKWSLTAKAKYLSAGVAVVADAFQDQELRLALGLRSDSLVRVIETFSDLPTVLLMNADRSNSIWGAMYIRVKDPVALDVLSDMIKFPDDELTLGDVDQLCTAPVPLEGD